MHPLVEDVLLVVDFMYLWRSLCTSGGVYVPYIYTHGGENCRRRLGSLLLRLCDVFRALINSLVCCFCTDAVDLVLLQVVMSTPYSLSRNSNCGGCFAKFYYNGQDVTSHCRQQQRHHQQQQQPQYQYQQRQTQQINPWMYYGFMGDGFFGMF